MPPRRLGVKSYYCSNLVEKARLHIHLEWWYGGTSDCHIMSKPGQADALMVVPQASPTSVVAATDRNSPEPLFLTAAATVANKGNHNEAWPTLIPSLKSQRTHNPIREIVDPILASLSEDDKKKMISLAVSHNLHH